MSFSSGCLGVRLDNGKRLTEPPWQEGFEQAVLAGPKSEAWCLEVLNTIAELEAQLESGE